MWKKSKRGGKYNGRYMRDALNKRVFVLTHISSTGKIHNLTFESYQMAKKLGWYKVK